MATVASMKAILSLSSQAFERGMKRSQRLTRRFARGIRSAGRAVSRFGGKLGAIAGIGGIAGIGFLIRQEMKALDAVAKTSDKLGIQSEKLIGLQFASRIAGIEIRTANMALQRMTRRMAEAAHDTGEAQAALRELGVDSKAFLKLPLEEQMFGLADAFESVTVNGEQVRLSMKLFDSEGVSMVNTLRLGRKGLMDLVKEAKTLGFAFSRQELRKIEDANDALTRTGLIMRGLIGRIGVSIAPVIEGLARELGGFASGLGQAGITQFIETWTVKIAAFLGGTLDILRIDIPSAIAFIGKAALAVIRSVVSTFDAIWGVNLEGPLKTIDEQISRLEEWHRGVLLKRSWAELFSTAIEGWFKTAAAAGGTRPKTIFTDLIDSMAKGVGAAGGRAQLALASELGVVGGQARFGVGGGVQSSAKKIESKFDTANTRLANIYKAIIAQSPLRVVQ